MRCLLLLPCALALAQTPSTPRRLYLRALTPNNNGTGIYSNTTQPAVPPLLTPSTLTSTSTSTQGRPSVGSPSPEEPPDSAPGPSDIGTCDDTVTYYGSVYATVYSTVTETYEVPVTASNVTLADAETLITPPPACRATVLPSPKSGEAIATERHTMSIYVGDPGAPSSDDGDSTLDGKRGSSAPTDDPSAGGVTSAFATLVPSGNATKSFLDGPATVPINISRPPQASAAPPPGPPPPPPGSVADIPKNGPDNGFGGGGGGADWSMVVTESTIYNTAPYTSTVLVTKKTSVPVVVPKSPGSPPVFGPSPPAEPTAGPNQPALPLDGQNRPVNPGGDSPILSLVVTNDPGPGATRGSPNIVPQTTIDNVPIAVRPSTVYIGNSAIPIPTVGGDEVVVSTADKSFTVRNNEVVAPSTTVRFGPLLAVGKISVAPTTVTAAPGVVVEVAGSTAVVDGTTFRLAQDFSTVITVSGQPISIGPAGVGLPQTTIAAAMTEVPEIIEIVGRVTVTLSGEEAIISGNHYGIASDSPTVTTQFEDQKVTIGPDGVIFPSTTVVPSRPTHTGAGDAQASSTGASGDNDSSGTPSTAVAWSIWVLSFMTTMLSVGVWLL
jgi:hypothetical protein